MKLIQNVSKFTNGIPLNYIRRKFYGTVNPQPMSKIPGPSSLPFIGPALHFLPGIGKYDEGFLSLENMRKLYRTYGKIIRFDSMLGTNPIIFILDPHLAEQILRGENTNPARKTFDTLAYYRTEIEKDKFEGARGLLVEQEATWREFRQKVNVPLLDLKMLQKYKNQIDEIAVEFVERLKYLRDDKNMIAENLSSELNKWSLESICLIALGTRLGAFKEGNDNPLIKRLIEANIEIFHLGYKLDVRPSIWKFYSTPNYKKMMKAYADQTRISEHYIQKAMEKFKTKNADNAELTILEKLLAIDPKVAVVMAGDMMMAGVDTVAITTVVLLYNLTQNKDKQNKLRKELNSENRREYLRACMRESFRLAPIVAGNGRTTTKEHILGGYRIPRGVDVIVCNEYLSNLESHFPQADKFLPERWIGEKTDPLHYSNAHPFTAIPFGFGSRACIGRRIAEMEMETLISHLIKNFDIDWAGPQPKKCYSVLCYFEPPYHFVFNDVK